MGKYFKSLFVAFVISLFLLVDNVNAVSLNSSCSSINQTCSTDYRFTYSNYGKSDDFYTGTFGTRISGKADYLVFDFDYSLLGNSTYSLTMSSDDVDFRNIKKSNTYLYVTTECATPTTELDITNVSFTQTRVVVTFKTISAVSSFMLIFGSDGASTNITGDNTWEVSSIDLTTIESNDTQNIIDNANQNANSIIENQNKNNEELKDTINDSLNSCRPSVNLININDFTANSSSSSNYIHLGDIYLDSGSYTLSWNQLNSMTSNVRNTPQIRFNGSAIALKDLENNNLNSGRHSFSFTANQSGTYSIYYWAHTFSTNTSFSKFQLEKGTVASSYEIYGQEICQSKIDETNDKLDNLTGAITDSSPPDTSGLADAPGWLPPGPVDSIVTLPINLLQSLTNNLESACTPINLPLPFVDSSLTISCPATLLKNIDGFWLFWESFGLIAGVWILYKYFINLYKWVESHLSMDEKESLGKWGGI